jgi:hypothetical protein
VPKLRDRLREDKNQPEPEKGKQDKPGDETYGPAELLKVGHAYHRLFVCDQKATTQLLFCAS